MSPTLVSHSGWLGPHEFTLVSHLSLAPVSHSGCLGPHEFTLVSHLSLTLGCLGRMSLHLFPLLFHTCLPLWVPWAACVCICLPHLSPTLVSHTCVPHLPPTLISLGRMILHLSPTRLPHVSPTLGVLWRMSLHLSPTCFPHLFLTLVSYTCFPLVSHTCLPHLSPILGCLGRMGQGGQ